MPGFGLYRYSLAIRISLLESPPSHGATRRDRSHCATFAVKKHAPVCFLAANVPEGEPRAVTLEACAKREGEANRSGRTIFYGQIDIALHILFMLLMVIITT